MPEDPERVIREVTFAVEGDGRTIEARIVPYGIDTKVVDSPANGGTGVPYMERWVPGAFGKQVSAPHRVWLNVEHEPGFRAVVGHGVALREAPDALYGTFRVEPGSDGDKALHMVNEGVLTGLSIEAIPRTTRMVGAVVERVKATLDKVSLVREGLAAYPAAEVLAVREKMTQEQAASFQDQWMAATASQRVEAGEPPWEFLKREEEPEPEEPAPDPEPAPEPQHTDEVNDALQRYGFESLTRRKVSTRPWAFSSARFTDEEYEASALVVRAGDEPPKERCSLPVLEPNGDVNANALDSAARRLSQVAGITNAQRATAARKLVRYYRQAGMEAPESVRNLARR